MNIKSTIKCTSSLLVGGALAYAYKDEIKQGIKKIKALATPCPKITAYLFYNGTPSKCECICDCGCECDNEAQQNECNNSDTDVIEECECCLQSDTADYVALFSEYSDKINTKLVNISCACKKEMDKFCDYTERFELDVLPAVLIISPGDNLMAKTECPQSVCEVRELLDSVLCKRLFA